jgi:hypothetical protein
MGWLMQVTACDCMSSSGLAGGAVTGPRPHQDRYISLRPLIPLMPVYSRRKDVRGRCGLIVHSDARRVLVPAQEIGVIANSKALIEPPV